MTQPGLIQPEGEPLSIRIVIAEDQPLLREALLHRFSREENFEVVGEARHRDEVFELLRRNEPDILLLDVDGYGADAPAAIERLTALRLKTRILLLAASNDVTRNVRAVRAGACGVVLKQSAPELLLKSIRKVHSGEFWLDHATMAAVMKEFGAPDDMMFQRADFTRREQKIVSLVGRGLRNRQIAEQLCVTEQTVKNSLHAIFRKLGIGSRAKLALYALEGRRH